MKRNLICKQICKQILMPGVVLPALVILLGIPAQAQKTSGMVPPGMEENTGPFSGGHGPKTFGGNSGPVDKPAVSSTPGEVHGVTRYANGLPIPGAEVAILNGDVDIDRTVVSGSDGTFVFKNLKPGEYQLTAKKEGFGLSPTTKVVLAYGKIVTVDVPLGPSFAVSPANTNPAGLLRPYNQSTHRVQAASLHLTPAQPTIDESAPAVIASATDAPKPAASTAEQPLPAAVMDEIMAMKK